MANKSSAIDKMMDHKSGSARGENRKEVMTNLANETQQEKEKKAAERIINIARHLQKEELTQKLSAGNPEAEMIVKDIIKKEAGYLRALKMDTLGMKGSEIVVGYKNVSKGNISEFQRNVDHAFMVKTETTADDLLEKMGDGGRVLSRIAKDTAQLKKDSMAGEISKGNHKAKEILLNVMRGKGGYLTALKIHTLNISPEKIVDIYNNQAKGDMGEFKKELENNFKALGAGKSTEIDNAFENLGNIIKERKNPEHEAQATHHDGIQKGREAMEEIAMRKISSAINTEGELNSPSTRKPGL